MSRHNPQCNCCSFVCCVFSDTFPSGAVSADWNVLSGSLTGDAINGRGTLAANSVVTATPTLPSGNGYFGANIIPNADGSIVSVKAAYVDADNHWRLDVHIETPHPRYGAGRWAHVVELFEIVGGVEKTRGKRWQGEYLSAAAAASVGSSAQFCWYEGGRLYLTWGVVANQFFIWPNNITGGNSFRIENESEVQIDGVSLCKHVREVANSCPCSGPASLTCMTCPNEEFSDLMQVEIMDGPDVGEIYIVDRAQFPDEAAGPFYLGISYWSFTNVPTSAVDDYDFSVAFCFDGNDAILRVTPPALSQVSSTFSVSDCVGPWDVVVSGVTYRITPL